MNKHEIPKADLPENKRVSNSEAAVIWILLSFSVFVAALAIAGMCHLSK